MSKPCEQKTVQARILAYAQEIGWSLVSREEAELRRGKKKGGQECPPSLFFEDLLHAKVREFNPRYAEAEGTLPGMFRHLHTDIYGNPPPPKSYDGTSRGKFFDHKEKRERDLILKRKRRLRGFPETAFRPRVPSPGKLNHKERRDHKEDFDSGSLSSLRYFISATACCTISTPVETI